MRRLSKTVADKWLAVRDRLFFEQFVDIFYIIERIIEIELQCRRFAQLIAHTLGELVAYRLSAFIDAVDHFLTFVRREYRQICARDRKIG